jgi:hypothetical protein
MSDIDQATKAYQLGLEMGELLQKRRSAKRRELMKAHIRKAKDLGIFLADDVVDLRGLRGSRWKLTTATKV